MWQLLKVAVHSYHLIIVKTSDVTLARDGRMNLKTFRFEFQIITLVFAIRRRLTVFWNQRQCKDISGAFLGRRILVSLIKNVMIVVKYLHFRTNFPCVCHLQTHFHHLEAWGGVDLVLRQQYELSEESENMYDDV